MRSLIWGAVNSPVVARFLFSCKNRSEINLRKVEKRLLSGEALCDKTDGGSLAIE